MLRLDAALLGAWRDAGRLAVGGEPPPGESSLPPRVSLCGRVTSRRRHGALTFCGLALLDGTSGGDGDGAAAAAAEGAPPPPAVQLVLERGHFEGGDARFALFVSALRPGAASHGQHCH